MSKQKGTTVHLIGNAHLDICWLWDYEEGVQEIRATFWSAIDRIKEYKDHIFTSASSCHYELVKRIDPTLFQEIQHAVAQGRWHITGGWYLQPDCNAPSGESFVRQGLYGQNFFQENFGTISKIGYNVDSFGHQGNLPQILQQQEMDSYVFMRPSCDEHDGKTDYLFDWQGVDGTIVQAARIPFSYTARDEWGSNLIEKLYKTIDLALEHNTPLMCFYGVGDHGGGPTKENLEALNKEMAKLIDTSHSVKYADTEEYFAFTKQQGVKVNTFEGELQHHAIGCYSLMAEVKRLNNACEHMLVQTEMLASLFGNLIDEAYNVKQFGENWKRVLFNQFHDILGGCSAPEIYEGVHHRYGHTINDLREQQNIIIQKIGSQLDTSDGIMRLLMVNSHSWPIEETVELSCLCDSITDEDGNKIPFQVVKGAPTGGFYAFHTKVRVTVPAGGYCTYQLHNVNAHAPLTLFAQTSQGAEPKGYIGNDTYRIHIDTHKRTIGEVFKGTEKILGGIAPVIIDDTSDAWSHGLTAFSGLRTYPLITRVQVVSEGPICNEYEISYAYQASSITLRFLFDHKSNDFEITLKTCWLEKQKMLKLQFQTPESAQYFSEIPYGVIKRDSDKREYPCQRWIAKSGVGIINNGVYSCSSSPNTLEYGILRSPGAAHHEPALLTDTTFHSYADQGNHEISFKISQGTNFSVFSKKAVEFNQKPLFLVESIHRGTLPYKKSLLDVNLEGAMVTTIKQAENGKGTIIRIIETSGKSHSEHICLYGIEFTVSFHPYEIKSLYVFQKGNIIKEVNLLEK